MNGDLFSWIPVRAAQCRELSARDLRVLIAIAGHADGKAWASQPSKPVLDREERHVETNGKKQYTAILAWPARETTTRWSAAVVDLVKSEHAEALQ